eukprot:CAMPEP_0173286464 /NCGR_PEP_ID=MMETSP1143-20121109/9205_1 /TAXON_ID=483371 /ORGANISM="non described non described, Strain CCMP2298" /LENGTH=268 /DNA_ID=CAMNT_0014224779 /DNA_START=265 /DNA_END=1075 /DNA_ORIENTATION=-
MIPRICVPRIPRIPRGKALREEGGVACSAGPVQGQLLHTFCPQPGSVGGGEKGGTVPRNESTSAAATAAVGDGGWGSDAAKAAIAAATVCVCVCACPCPCPCPCPTAFVKLARARCPGRENLLRMSASLLPSTGVSTVTAIALNPAASALLMSCRVRARSLYRYSWNQCLPVGAAAATSSMEVVDRVDRPISTPRLAAALAVASSPSGCAMRCIAVGATQMGDETLSPRMVVLVSIFETSRSTLGRSLSLSKAALFSLNVVMSVAPLA